MAVWIADAARREVVLPSLRLCLVVGTVLVAITHGDAILPGAITSGQWVKIGLTYLVPYSVSTYASVRMIRKTQTRDQGQ